MKSQMCYQKLTALIGLQRWQGEDWFSELQDYAEKQNKIPILTLRKPKSCPELRSGIVFQNERRTELKVAIIGSRSLSIDVSHYVPKEATTIISGGAKGIDQCAADYARKHWLELVEFLPDYKRYGDEIISAIMDMRKVEKMSSPAIM